MSDGIHRTNLSIHPGLYEAAVRRMTELHHRTFSGYVEELIRQDALRNAEHGHMDEATIAEPKSVYKSKSKRAG